MQAHHRLTALCLMIAGICVAHAAIAQDIFVKPNQASPHPADLGLGVKTAPQPTVAPPVAKQPTQPVEQPQVIPQPVAEPTPQPVPQPIPQPIAQPTPQPLPPRGNVEIITVPDEKIVIPPGSGPNVFSINILPASIGQSETNDIYKTLGLNSQEIAANCAIENLVVLSIGDNGSAITMGQLPAAQTRFSGNISGIDIFPTIACKKIRPPINGIVIEQGPYYKISAQNSTCPPPRGGSVNVSFKYLGNGKADCQYK